MSPRFSLESVLRYRSRLVSESQQELAQLEADRMRHADELDRLMNRRDDQVRALRPHQESMALDLEVIRRRLAYVELVKRAIRNEETSIEELAVAIETKRDELIERSKSEELLKQLKQRRFQEARRELARAETRAYDEIGAIQFVHRGRGG